MRRGGKNERRNFIGKFKIFTDTQNNPFDNFCFIDGHIFVYGGL